MTTHIPSRDWLGEGGWWLLRLLLAGVSVVALLSYGGQLVLAPILLPLQWGAARASGTAGRALFNVLAALLMIEIGVLLGALATGEAVAGVVAGLAVALGGSFWFYRSTRPE